MIRLTSGENGSFPGYRQVPKTGVIYVMSKAAELGFFEERESWANLGQGAPETGPLPSAPNRITSLDISEEDCEYAPILGLPELRDAVAELYNTRFRKGHKSKYSRENVAICGGGRLALTRLVSTLGNTNVGHFLPDYTAYEELLGSFGTFVPIPILTDEEGGFTLTAEQLRREIQGRGLSAILLSNPCNPTGSTISGGLLESWVNTCTEESCSLMLDEFYSHYTYSSSQPAVSAAEYVQDVEGDPILIFDGLTKNWRYPGFRVSWTIGPSEIIDAVASAGSFIDGGCSRPMQRAALKLLSPESADAEASAIRKVFSEKRDLMLSGLEELGVRVDPAPAGGFYCWGDLRGLPEELQSGSSLFEKLLEEQAIIVPGVFFDINPGRRRPDRASRFGHYARFSFGPPVEELKLGLSKLKKVIKG